MRNRILLAAALLGGALGFSVESYAQSASPLGVWNTAQGKGRVRITDCGGALCGNLIWLAEPTDEQGQPKRDIRNKDTARRNRPLIGVPILISMKKDQENRWRGNIYNAEDGETYTAYLTVENAGQLKVQGCILMGAVCRDQSWTRAR